MSERVATDEDILLVMKTMREGEGTCRILCDVDGVWSVGGTKVAALATGTFDAVFAMTAWMIRSALNPEGE